jgi:hypothetical protein
MHFLFPYLPTFSHLTFLSLRVDAAKSSLDAAARSISQLASLEQLVFSPATLSFLGKLAHGGNTLHKLTYVAISGACVTAGEENICHFLRNDKKLVGGYKAFLEQSTFPSLKALVTTPYACSKTLWHLVASLAPKLEHLSVGEHILTGNNRPIFPKIYKSIHSENDTTAFNRCLALWKDDVDVYNQVQVIARLFPALKEMGYTLKYSLKGIEIAEARIRSEEIFEMILRQKAREEEEEAAQAGKEKLLEEQTSINSTKLVSALSPTVLQYDERYKYSKEEMEAIGKGWADSAQGKKHTLKLTSELLDRIDACQLPVCTIALLKEPCSPGPLILPESPKKLFQKGYPPHFERLSGFAENSPAHFRNRRQRLIHHVLEDRVLHDRDLNSFTCRISMRVSFQYP